MGKILANKNMTVHAYQMMDGDISANLQVLTPESPKVTADGAGIYAAAAVQVMMPAGVTCVDGFVTSAPLIVAITPTGKPTSFNMPVLCKGDKANGVVTGNGPNGATKPETFTVEVVDAGQTKVEVT